MSPHYREERPSEDVARPPKRSTLLVYIVVSGLLSGTLGSGGTLAVIKANAADRDRRIEALEKSVSADHDLVTGLVKDVEWLVRRNGGEPAAKGKP